MTIDQPLGYKPPPEPAKCSHPWCHTVYGASDPERNGITCVICGEKPQREPWRSKL